LFCALVVGGGGVDDDVDVWCILPVSKISGTDKSCIYLENCNVYI